MNNIEVYLNPSEETIDFVTNNTIGYLKRFDNDYLERSKIYYKERKWDLEDMLYINWHYTEFGEKWSRKGDWSRKLRLAQFMRNNEETIRTWNKIYFQKNQISNLKGQNLLLGSFNLKDVVFIKQSEKF